MFWEFLFNLGLIELLLLFLLLHFFIELIVFDNYMGSYEDVSIVELSESFYTFYSLHIYSFSSCFNI